MGIKESDFWNHLLLSDLDQLGFLLLMVVCGICVALYFSLLGAFCGSHNFGVLGSAGACPSHSILFQLGLLALVVSSVSL